MKKKALTFLSMTFSLALQAKEAQKPIHIVLKDESFSAIVRKYTMQKGKKLPFSSQYYKNAFKLFQESNRQIKNFNLIYPNQKIYIPKQFFPKNKKNKIKYKIKKNDNLWNLALRFYKGQNPWVFIRKIQKDHPYQIKNVHLIREKEYLYLPLNIKASQKKPLPRKVISYTPDLEHEIYRLTTQKAKTYIKYFEKIITAKNKNEILLKLQTSYQLAHQYQNKHLKNTFSQLIQISKEDKENELYLKDIQSFFSLWKKNRKRQFEDRKRGQW